MGPEGVENPLASLHSSHPRNWRDNLYVYPVISRRGGGLSIGVNLNPDKACNYDCIYCQVDRSVPGTRVPVDLGRLSLELEATLRSTTSGELFTGPPFDRVPSSAREIRDIAFSGDGEPTSAAEFAEAVRIAAELRRGLGLDAVKIILITNAALLHLPVVRETLAIMAANNGEIWAKLDAGTDEYHRQINRCSIPLQKIVENILAASQICPLVVQSLWMTVHGRPPSPEEVDAFAQRLRWIVDHGGRIRLVQIYTVARRTAEAFVAPLTDVALNGIAERVRAVVGLCVEVHGC